MGVGMKSRTKNASVRIATIARPRPRGFAPVGGWSRTVLDARRAPQRISIARSTPRPSEPREPEQRARSCPEAPGEHGQAEGRETARPEVERRRRVFARSAALRERAEHRQHLEPHEPEERVVHVAPQVIETAARRGRRARRSWRRSRRRRPASSGAPTARCGSAAGRRARTRRARRRAARRGAG